MNFKNNNVRGSEPFAHALSEEASKAPGHDHAEADYVTTKATVVIGDVEDRRLVP